MASSPSLKIGAPIFKCVYYRIMGILMPEQGKRKAKTKSNTNTRVAFCLCN